MPHPKTTPSFRTFLTMYLFHLVVEGKEYSSEEFPANFRINDDLVVKYTTEYWQTDRNQTLPGTNLKVDSIYHTMNDLRKKHAGEIIQAKKEYGETVLNERFPIDAYETVLSQNECDYCGITEKEIQELASKHQLFKKNERGWKLEMDRKNSNFEYSKTNCVMSCYWCNNAKTDEFTHKEFKIIGKAIRKVWEERLEQSLNSNP